MKIFLRFYLLLVMLQGSVLATNIELSGTVSGNYIVDTVLVTSDLFIANGTSLQFEAGTKVLFDGFYFIDVQGCIVANGTGALPVIFTVTDTLGFTDTLAMHGGWHGIRFLNTPSTNPTSVFTNSQFLYTKALDLDSLMQFGGAIHADGYSNVQFIDCQFINNHAYYRGGAVSLLNQSNIKFTSCTFQNNATMFANAGYGGAIYSESSDPEFINCSFYNNDAVWTGGGICFYFGNPLVQNCIFAGNSGFIGGAMSFYQCHPTRSLCNNLIYLNMADFFGGGISCNSGSDPVFVNNTMADNISVYGGGLYCNDSAAPTLYNSIIWGNVNLSALGPVYIWDPLSHPNFYYCDVEGGKEAFAGSGGGLGYFGMYENNLDTLPGFETGFYPYFLTFDSPLIDAGTPDIQELGLPPHDLVGLPRVFMGRIDLGPYEIVYEGVHSNSDISKLCIFPNPVYSHLSFDVPADWLHAGIVAEVRNTDGRTVLKKCFTNSDIDARESLEVDFLPAGSYFLLISQNNAKAIGQFIKL